MGNDRKYRKSSNMIIVLTLHNLTSFSWAHEVGREVREDSSTVPDKNIIQPEQLADLSIEHNCSYTQDEIVIFLLHLDRKLWKGVWRWRF